MKLSIVIPTYKEKENLEELIPEVQSQLKQKKVPYEIIIVDDDSNDGTEELINSMKNNQVRLMVRKQKRGLSSAVFDGLMQAEGKVLCFMDADFSHPPTALPGMYEMVSQGKADIVVGSRLVKGGGMDDWPLWRKFTSWVARVMARPLTPVKDVTSGFFMFKRDVLPNRPLNLQGFKIGLELLVKGNYTKVDEYPIIFQDRKHGDSKLSGKVIFDYMKHLQQLYVYKMTRRFR